jgi:hypothetical protein
MEVYLYASAQLFINKLTSHSKYRIYGRSMQCGLVGGFSVGFVSYEKIRLPSENRVRI